jgi:hypothetical protein
MQAPLRGARDQYSCDASALEEAKTCTPHLWVHYVARTMVEVDSTAMKTNSRFWLVLM